MTLFQVFIGLINLVQDLKVAEGKPIRFQFSGDKRLNVILIHLKHVFGTRIFNSIETQDI